ncbi:MAG: hypothetical protein ACRELA_00785 [Candidatus Rokuibacteriota bacterium]
MTADLPSQPMEKAGRTDHGAPSSQTWIVGGGELGERIRALDWSATPLGPLDTWPSHLRASLSICLGSRYPIVIYWGPDFTVLYNDAWIPIPGGKHPWALGRSGREVWSEIWDVIGPMLEGVVTTGDATRVADQQLFMQRHGYLEECYFGYSSARSATIAAWSAASSRR